MSGTAAAQPFPSQPNWSSGPPNPTYAVAFADFDADGDLDLVCGNFNAGSVVYENREGRLDQTPVWVGPTYFTLGVAVGDIDGDGDMDIVLANSVSGNVAFRNDGNFVFAGPVWSVPSTVTSDVELADINGDRVLDVVFGISDTLCTAFFGNGTSFSTSPDWTAGENRDTRAIAIGDLNHDGRPDLVTANFDTTVGNHVYFGDGGAFDAMPGWVSTPARLSLDVELADVNMDGHLDAIFINDQETAALYLNDGSTLLTQPAWLSDTIPSITIAAGDVTGDSIPDLLIGHPGTIRPALFIGDGATFSSTSPSYFGIPSSARDVALADLTGEGDLDLVLGDLGTNTAYVNTAPSFQFRPVPLPSVDATLGIAVGDVDRDGLPDVVTGNASLGPNRLFINNGVGFVETWSGGATSTFDVTLEDVNSDGWLDLLCGNQGSATVHNNVGGLFETLPSWIVTQAGLSVNSIATADVNGDSLPDVVLGISNALEIYFNNGIAFDTVIGWSPAMWGDWGTVVDALLADVNRDGRPDLVAAGSGFGRNPLFSNTGTTLESEPSWLSRVANESSSVAVGDVSGDGYPEVAFGNFNQSNTLYLNSVDSLGTQPVWGSGPRTATHDVGLADIDGDGDLDLVTGYDDFGSEQGVSIYVNDGGALRLSPEWTGLAFATRAMALSDMDRDGDTDLVLGNFNEPGVVLMNRRNPAFYGDPTAPVGHGPNNDASLYAVTARPVRINALRVLFRAVDVESDPVWIRTQYQFEGDPVWHPAGTSTLQGPFGSSPAGVVDSLEWDVSLFPIDNRDVILRLVLIETPLGVSSVRRATSHLTNIGVVVPRRPGIAKSEDVLAFPTATLGDVDSLEVVLSNAGNQILVIQDIRLPSLEMRSSAVTPINLQPQGQVTVRVFIEPVQQLDISGNIEIDSNDPTIPTDLIGVTTDIRELVVETRVLSPDRVLPLGEAVTIIVEPLPDVSMDGGSLFHRSVGALNFNEILLQPSGNDFIAVIPGASVTEEGIEYYVRVDNGPVSGTDPPGAPDSVFTQEVAPPGSVSSESADPNPSIGDSIQIRVTLPQGATFVGGTLYYRAAATPVYAQRPLVPTGPDAGAAVIPDSVVTARGVEYWVEAQSLTDTLSDPAANPAVSPRSIQLIVDDLIEPDSHPGGRYRLFSIPLDMSGSILGSVADELGGQDPTRWRLFAYQNAAGAYLELPNDSLSSFEQGRGYWLITRSTHRIGTGDDSGRTAATDVPFSISLRSGYNLIASPFAFEVAWDSALVDTSLVERPIAWVPGSGYAVADVLEPFAGYWVKNRAPSPVTIGVRAVEPAPSPVVLEAREVDGWTVRIRARSGEMSDGFAFAGVRSGAATEWDPGDLAKPPMAPGTSLYIHFPHGEWQPHPDLYARDVRGDYERVDDAWGHAWHFDVARNADEEGEVVLTVEDVTGVDADASVFLIDHHLDRAIDLRDRDSYAYYEGERAPVAGAGDTRFTLVVGSEEFVRQGGLPQPPASTALHQNHPNPFNPSTRFRYDIADPGVVTLRVYDVAGALVRELYRGPRQPGVYEALWNGRNESDQPVASGVYFYRLEAAGVTKTRKMVLLK